MRHILCYGDSNTWGYTPGTGERHAPDVRWTGVLRRLLGEGWEVLEEGMNGRTTVFDNPMSPGRNGSVYLLTCLETHKPLDLVILMLGTNDLRFTDAWGAAEGAAALVKKVRLYNHMEESTHIFPGKPRILLIAPILAHADLDNRDVIGRWRSYPQKSRGFAAAYAAVAASWVWTFSTRRPTPTPPRWTASTWRRRATPRWARPWRARCGRCSRASEGARRHAERGRRSRFVFFAFQSKPLDRRSEMRYAGSAVKPKGLTAEGAGREHAGKHPAGAAGKER